MIVACNTNAHQCFYSQSSLIGSFSHKERKSANAMDLSCILFPQTVHCWGTQFYLKVCPPCVRGCVRLRTICLPIHLSPNSFVSQVLCQGLCPPPGDLSPNSFVSQFIRLPGPVSRVVSASGGFVSQFICLPGPLSRAVSALPGFVSHHLFLKSCVRGCVRLRGICLPIHLSPNSFVSQVLCQWLCPPPGDLSPN